MKLPLKPNRERGFFATIIMIAILGIILIFVAANAKRIYQLDRELKLVEQRQVNRLNPPASPTNHVAASVSTNSPAATPP
jgi:Na+/melibiose symporter-like transporter